MRASVGEEGEGVGEGLSLRITSVRMASDVVEPKMAHSIWIVKPQIFVISVYINRTKQNPDMGVPSNAHSNGS